MQMHYLIFNSPFFILFFGFGLILFISFIDLYCQSCRRLGNKVLKNFQYMIEKIRTINYFSLLTWFFFSVLFVIIISFFNMISFLFFPYLQIYPLNSNFWAFFYVLVLIFLPFLVFNLIIIHNSDKWFLESLKNSNRKADSQIEHHAIIISSSTKIDKKIGLFVGTDLLIRYFIQNSIPYQINLCCPKRANLLIRDEKTKFLYLFGHGFQGGLVFHQIEKKARLKYDCFDNLPVKKTIAQMHCNSGNEKSLCEKCQLHIQENKCFILKGVVRGINYGPDLWLNVKVKILKFVSKNQNHPNP